MFVIGEYNWGVQPGLKNLTDHFLEEWFWRPAAIASYSAGRCPGRGRARLARHPVGDGHGGHLEHGHGRADRRDPGRRGAADRASRAALERAFARFADDLAWWAEAAKAQRAVRAPPY